MFAYVRPVHFVIRKVGCLIIFQYRKNGTEKLLLYHAEKMHMCGTAEVSDQGYSEGRGVRTRAFVSKGDGHKLSDGKFLG